jgi:hypothetical protein
MYRRRGLLADPATGIAKGNTKGRVRKDMLI